MWALLQLRSINWADSRLPLVLTPDIGAMLRKYGLQLFPTHFVATSAASMLIPSGVNCCVTTQLLMPHKADPIVSATVSSELPSGMGSDRAIKR